ncbi:hypothetical protein IH980_00340 [Patescibacteria group bacterium]|nr:hypothetical protein [Patescibacteria group bacterium]
MLENFAKPQIVVDYAYQLRDGKTGHHLKYSTYSPDLFVRRTLLSTENDAYFATAIHERVTVVLSYHQESDSSRAFHLLLWGGTEQAKQAIVEGIGSTLEGVRELFAWSSVTPVEVKERGKYVWEVQLE